MTEEIMVKLGELIQTHAGAALIFQFQASEGMVTQLPINGAQYTETLDGQKTITLY